MGAAMYPEEWESSFRSAMIELSLARHGLVLSEEKGCNGDISERKHLQRSESRNKGRKLFWEEGSACAKALG
jgi:hypothetical protein